MKQNLFILLFLIIGTVCNAQTKTEIESIFTKEEQYTKEKIVSYLDSVVFKFAGIEEIDMAYQKYFKLHLKKIEETGSISFYGFDNEKMDIFLKSLNQQHLKEYYVIKDTLKFKDYKTKEFKIITDAYDKDIYRYGKYEKILQMLKNENEIINHYYDNLHASGGTSPSNFSLIVKRYSELDLHNTYHRLIIAITLFSVNERH